MPCNNIFSGAHIFGTHSIGSPFYIKRKNSGLLAKFFLSLLERFVGAYTDTALKIMCTLVSVPHTTKKYKTNNWRKKKKEPTIKCGWIFCCNGIPRHYYRVSGFYRSDAADICNVMIRDDIGLPKPST